MVDAHRPLVAGSAVSKKNQVLLSGDKDWIVPRHGKIHDELLKKFHELLLQYSDEAGPVVEMYEKIGLKWVDRNNNKGDSVHENYRSRLVVREIKKVRGHWLSLSLSQLCRHWKR